MFINECYIKRNIGSLSYKRRDIPVHFSHKYQLGYHINSEITFVLYHFNQICLVDGNKSIIMIEFGHLSEFYVFVRLCMHFTNIVVKPWHKCYILKLVLILNPAQCLIFSL